MLKTKASNGAKTALKWLEVQSNYNFSEIKDNNLFCFCSRCFYFNYDNFIILTEASKTPIMLNKLTEEQRENFYVKRTTNVLMIL